MKDAINKLIFRRETIANDQSVSMLNMMQVQNTI